MNHQLVSRNVVNYLNDPLFLGAVIFSIFTSFSVAQQPPPPPPPPPSTDPVPTVPEPTENPITEAKRVLGKILFWDEQLSSDDTMSCGTCHIPSSTGADPRFDRHPGADRTFFTPDDVFGSPGVVAMDTNGDPVVDPVFGIDPQVTGRAAQSYFMSLFAEDAFWDGRATSEFIDPEDGVTTVIAAGGSLESQAVGPILSSVEMAHPGRSWSDVRTKLQNAIPLLFASDIPDDMESAIQANSTYAALFNAAFGSTAITGARIGMAIASYERTLVADQTPWDAYNAGDTGALTANQIQGWNFFGNSRCVRCHVPPLFTDNEFHNIGLRPSGDDLGREAITGDPNDRGRFKTPSLRNTGLRANLMHVGWIADVRDAIDFYNEGAGHNQFEVDQSGIPTNDPNVFENYDQASIPIDGPNNQPVRNQVVDFITNALTDARVANETFPFDRPTLYSELPPADVIICRFDYVGFENGTLTKPYNTPAEAAVHVAEGETIHFVAGSIDDTLTLDKSMTLLASGGTVRIGGE